MYMSDRNLIRAKAIFGSGTHLVLVLVVLLFGATSSKSPRFRRFRSDRGEIWQDFSSSKYVSIDVVGFSI